MENIAFANSEALRIGGWDNIEVSPCKGDGETNVCPEEEAEFFGVYLKRGAEAEWVADMPTRELAESLAKLIYMSVKTALK